MLQKTLFDGEVMKIRYVIHSIFIAGPRSAIYAFKNMRMSFIFKVQVALWIWRKIVIDTMRYGRTQ